MVHYILFALVKLFFVCFSASKFGKVIGFSLALGREKTLSQILSGKGANVRGVQCTHIGIVSSNIVSAIFAKDALDSLDMSVLLDKELY